MTFELFPRPVPVPEPPQIIVSQTSIILNKAAWAAIYEPTGVDLLWDRDNRVIGIRASNAPSAFDVMTLRGNGATISAARPFLDHIGAGLVLLRRHLDAYVQDGILCAHLDQPGSSTRLRIAGT